MRKSSSTWKVLVRPETTETLRLELKTPDPKNLCSFPHQHCPSVLPFPLQSTWSPRWPVSDFCIPPKNPRPEDQPSHPASVRSKQRGFTAKQSQMDFVAKLMSEVLNVCPKKPLLFPGQNSARFRAAGPTYPLRRGEGLCSHVIFTS